MEEKNQDLETKKKDKTLMIALSVLVIASAALAIAGFLFMRPAPDYYQGQAEATSVRISGKLMGRVARLFVEAGDKVKAGDTIAQIHSSLVDAQLMQAEAMEGSVASQNKKIDAGTRKQLVEGAYNIWQQALAAEGITQKTYDRLERLYKEGVVTEQKRDEAQAAYKASQAATAAAKSQYDMALAGAQKEDKASAAYMVEAAKGNVDQVKALLEDSYLVAPCDGEISDIYPEVSELVAPGAPIASVMKDDIWFTFNVREDKLADLPMGAEVEVMIPALNKQKVKAKIYYIHDMGSYAVWSATKATGEYDTRTFQVKMRPTEKVENLRPGMSAILEK